MLTPVAFPNFGGLELRNDPEDLGVGQAVDAINVSVDRDGRLRSRYGYTSWGTVTEQQFMCKSMFTTFGTTTASSLLWTMATGAGTLDIKWYDQNGTASAFQRVATSTDAVPNGWVATVGIPLTVNTFYTMSGFADLFYNTAGTIAGLGGGPLAVTPWDNRLVACCNDRVNFSNNDDPTIITEHVDVSPGDGETILEAVAWRDYLFVFKQSKFFVFYGTSTHADGTPEFPYRTINAQAGVYGAQSAIATPEGVYFVNDAGVWLTTGDRAVRVSEPIDPLFRQDLTLRYTTSASAVVDNRTSMRVTTAGRFLFVLLGSSGMLAMDRETKQWTAHDIPATHGSGMNTTNPTRPGVDGQSDLFFVGASHIFRVSQFASTDNGTAISSRWRSGFFSPGQPSSEFYVREMLLDGTGTVSVATAVNDAVSVGTGASVTLGTAPAIAQGRDRRGVRGRNVSLQLSATVPWSLSRAVLNVSGQRQPGSLST